MIFPDKSDPVLYPVSKVFLSVKDPCAAPIVFSFCFDLSGINLAKTFWKELKA